MGTGKIPERNLMGFADRIFPTSKDDELSAKDRAKGNKDDRHQKYSANPL